MTKKDAFLRSFSFTPFYPFLLLPFFSKPFFQCCITSPMGPEPYSFAYIGNIFIYPGMNVINWKSNDIFLEMIFLEFVSSQDSSWRISSGGLGPPSLKYYNLGIGPDISIHLYCLDILRYFTGYCCLPLKTPTKIHLWNQSSGVYCWPKCIQNGQK